MQPPSSQRDPRLRRRGAVAAGIAGNLVAGVRLAFARPVRGEDFDGSAVQLGLAFGALWAAVVLGEKLVGGASSVFWAWGFSAFAARVYVWLSAVVLIAWCCHAGRSTMPLVVALLYAAGPIALTAAVVGHVAATLDIDPAPAHRTLFAYALAAWYALVFWRALVRFTATRSFAAAGASGAYAAMLIAVNALLPASPMFYVSEPPAAQLDIESIYYRQQALVDRQVAALPAETPGVIDIYFLSVAAYAAQDVFLREALAAREIAEQRLALGGRSAALVNNARTVEELPLANGPNLARTLRGFGRAMDREQDIAFVFITSHGNENASVAGEFGALSPNDLHAAAVRRALDEAGIRWRIVVISACYSGGFIEALRSPTSLVITAAAADRASFGCAHENDWTYFGEAYFAEALAATRAPDLAFAAARESIRARERREGKPPSKPQMALGPQMQRHLREWLTRFPDGSH